MPEAQTPDYRFTGEAKPDESAAFQRWFQGEQGKLYDGMWAFARAAWMARAATTPASAGASGPTYEQHRAIRQGHEIASSDGYFDARPQIDTRDRRNVFCAGFERGWDAAIAAQGERNG